MKAPPTQGYDPNIMPCKPNILYLNTHDTGRWVGPLGAAVRTPHLDQLAARGSVLRDCHCAGPTCSPSRAGLLTGMWPHSCGMLGLAHRGFALSDDRWHLAHHFAEHGYRTATWGMPANHVKADLPGGPVETAAAVGYQCWLGGHENIQPALDFLLRPSPRPFLLSLSWFFAHRKGRGFSTNTDLATYPPARCAPPAILPDTPENRADLAQFASDVTAWDGQLGEVLDALRIGGQAANTIVIVTTDHGIPFPGHKCTLTHHGTGVFMVLAGPGGFEGGGVVDHLVSQIDVLPTLCGIAGIPVPERLQGVDFRPTLGPEGRAVRTDICCEVNWHAAYEPMRCIRTKEWNLVRRFGGRRLPVAPNCDLSPSRDSAIAAGALRRPHPGTALYDLRLDPQERDNRVADPECAMVRIELEGRLRCWMEATADPLLESEDLVPPPGVIITPADASDPESTAGQAATLAKCSAPTSLLLRSRHSDPASGLSSCLPLHTMPS